jgi:hypothetical protein
MDELFKESLKVMLRAFSRLESQIEPPKFVSINEHQVFRYSEKSIEQAIIQKLARILSGLQAAWALLVNGFVQEQGVIQRTLDEFYEDVQFLAIARTNDTLTKLHQEYLDAFYMEEFDEHAASPTSYPKRPMVSREKIRAYCSRILSVKDPSTPTALGTKLSKAYSGFVHGASPHIMDMYGGDPPRFHTTGLLGTPLIPLHHDDLRNYFYRALLAFGAGAKAFGDKELFDSLALQITDFEKFYGSALIMPPKK